jgi:hypothetical protein
LILIIAHIISCMVTCIFNVLRNTFKSYGKIFLMCGS